VAEMTLQTPAYIFDQEKIESACALWARLCKRGATRQFFPLKCNSSWAVLSVLAEKIDGFSVSSLFEAQLAYELVGTAKPIHFSGPGFRQKEAEQLFSCINHVVFNSLTQLLTYQDLIPAHIGVGLRVNPEISFVRDERYDPSRRGSKLGVPLADLKTSFETDAGLFARVSELQFHNNCDATDWLPILRTVERLKVEIPGLLARCSSINLGGGYLLSEETDLSPYFAAMQILETEFGLSAIIEPGAAVVREAGTLTSSIIDLFRAGDSEIIVLDTSVNHIPECFEYQFSPDVIGEEVAGAFDYVLAGSTCLAGDVFGEYSFDEPLALGGHITFKDVGAYAAVKAHMFNGICLPATYLRDRTGALVLKNTSNYSHFRSVCGSGSNETL
jgi:carboxynorspermidine decarboxylase